MKKSLVFAIAVGTLTVASIPTWLMWQSLNNMQAQLQTTPDSVSEVSPPTTTVPPAAPTATAEQLEAERLEAEQLAQEAERQRQAAAQQQAYEDLIALTGETWQGFLTILGNTASISSNSDDPMAALEYVLVELEALPKAGIDQELAALIADFYRVLYDGYQVESNYQTQLAALGVNVAEAGKFGCDIAKATAEENQLGWCLGMGLLTGTAVAAGASEQAKQLEAEYNERGAALAAQMAGLPERIEAMSAYLSAEYGIAAY